MSMVIKKLIYGKKFDSFEELSQSIEQFQIENFCRLRVRDSKTIKTYLKRFPEKQIKAELKFHYINFCCIHGGKNSKSKSAEIGPNQTELCPASIKVSLTKDAEQLEIVSMKKNHNHECNQQGFLTDLESRKSKMLYSRPILCRQKAVSEKEEEHPKRRCKAELKKEREGDDGGGSDDDAADDSDDDDGGSNIGGNYWGRCVGDGFKRLSKISNPSNTTNSGSSQTPIFVTTNKSTTKSSAKKPTNSNKINNISNKLDLFNVKKLRKETHKEYGARFNKMTTNQLKCLHFANGYRKPKDTKYMLKILERLAKEDETRVEDLVEICQQVDQFWEVEEITSETQGAVNNIGHHNMDNHNDENTNNNNKNNNINKTNNNNNKNYRSWKKASSKETKPTKGKSGLVGKKVAGLLDNVSPIASKVINVNGRRVLVYPKTKVKYGSSGVNESNKDFTAPTTKTINENHDNIKLEHATNNNNPDNNNPNSNMIIEADDNIYSTINTIIKNSTVYSNNSTIHNNTNYNENTIYSNTNYNEDTIYNTTPNKNIIYNHTPNNNENNNTIPTNNENNNLNLFFGNFNNLISVEATKKDISRNSSNYSI